MNARDLENILNELKLQRLSPSALKIFGEIARWWRGRGQGNSQAPVDPRRWGKNVQWIKAASSTTGYVTHYNGYTDEWRDETQLLQIRGVGGTPTTGERYLGVQTGQDASERGKFTVLVPTGGGGGFAASAYANADSDTLHVAWLGEGLGNGPAPTTFFTTTGALFAAPFVAPSVSIDRIGAWIGFDTNATGSIRLGIYNSNSRTDIFPRDLLVDSGDITIADGYVEATVSLDLSDEILYWAAVRIPTIGVGTLLYMYGVVQNDAANFFPLGLSRSDLIAAPDDTFVQNSHRPGYFKTGLGAIAALPDPFPTDADYLGAEIADPLPLVFLRYA